ncbi:CRS2-associated factor 2, mitochondrial isoform X2 [Phalaenopsis equestris]|uniref:CRS2-associated factor 2, mitochondrial isoform X2 n=1 Tax=Phalaenopsis equestris TaxID=78828 RepID=UPI0009E4B891|nr:CRS2-associated factor 2, mitochondrial isoform X2 [Phalaenopsis equestris]
MRRNPLSSTRPAVQTLTPNHNSFLSFLSPHHSLSRSKKKIAAPRDESDDPPFSPLTKIKQPKPDLPPRTLVSGKGKTPAPFHSDLPFDFRFSYSETDASVRPIGFREPPRFSPFGPGRLDRKWNGVSAPAVGEFLPEGAMEEQRRFVLGEPLSEEEVEELVERYRHNDCSRQINLGRGGVTHNMIDDIHNHWKRADAVRIKCLGVPTLDMDNVCFHLEDKTGGKIIYRNINTLLLYRGRNYDSENRPIIPPMLWKPLAPIYPRLVKNIADGLTFEETKAMRNKGLNSPSLMKLSRNGVYITVVERIREAFKTLEVVRLDCSHAGSSDCKKIGVKLRDLVPCVPILFKDEQIILWRGKEI